MRLSPTQKALDTVEDALRRLEWRVNNPNKNAKEEAPAILQEGLDALLVVKGALERRRLTADV